MTGESRLGILDLYGEGEAVGGIVVMRYGENAAEVIAGVKEKMKEVANGLPEGVAFNIVYERRGLINESVSSFQRKRIAEMIVVSLVWVVLLFTLRGQTTLLIQLP